MTRSLQHFGEDDEAASTLKDLGYSDEEIGRTAGSMPSEMAEEERLRLSLRALSQHKSEQVQERAEAASPPPNAKMFDKQERPVEGEEAYERGRRDERYLKKNDPSYVKPPRTPRPRSAAAQRADIMRPVKKWQGMARKAKGRRR